MTKNSVRTAFTVSIVLNFLLLGVIGGITLRQPPKPWHEIKAEMSPQTQHLIARNIQKSRHDMSAEIKKMRAAKKSIIRAMNAKEFDTDSYERAMKKLQTARTKINMSQIESMKALASELSREERQKLAKGFGHRPGEYHKKSNPKKDSEKLWPPPFKNMVMSAREDKPDRVMGPPERKPTYGPAQQQKEPKQKLFGPPPEPSNP